MLRLPECPAPSLEIAVEHVKTTWQNPVLKDRDMVYVPPKTISPAGNITVEGAVAKPGLVPVRESGVPLTLREAISQAGGPTATGRGRPARSEAAGPASRCYRQIRLDRERQRHIASSGRHPRLRPP